MKRLTIRLPDPAHQALEQRAQAAGEPLASMAAGLLRTAIDDEEVRPARRLRAERPTPRRPIATSGPPWLPPDGDKEWGPNMWAAIVALHKRYPGALAKLEHDWHERPERTETLAALAIWRANIDAAAEDPREELAFHNAIQQLARTLDQTLGIVRPFKAGRRCRTAGSTRCTGALRFQLCLFLTFGAVVGSVVRCSGAVAVVRVPLLSDNGNRLVCGTWL
jgi:hypothetical protein